MRGLKLVFAGLFVFGEVSQACTPPLPDPPMWVINEPFGQENVAWIGVELDELFATSGLTTCSCGLDTSAFASPIPIGGEVSRAWVQKLSGTDPHMLIGPKYLEFVPDPGVTATLGGDWVGLVTPAVEIDPPPQVNPGETLKLWFEVDLRNVFEDLDGRESFLSDLVNSPITLPIAAGSVDDPDHPLEIVEGETMASTIDAPITGQIDPNGTLVIQGNGQEVVGLNLISSGSNLIPNDSSNPFDVFVSNDTEQVTIGNLGNPITIDGPTQVSVNFSTLADPWSDLTAEWGDTDSERNSFPITLGDGIVCDPNTGGDVDGDGMVAFSDFLILSANFGQEAEDHTQGDIDCDGSVGFPDFLLLSANFGNAAVSSVPEPSGNFLACFLGLSIVCIGRRKRK